MKKYRKHVDQLITAVQINLETEGIQYTKWGGVQCCSAGDWLVDNGGDCYTISAESFADTYEEVTPGRYRKMATVSAELATSAGSVKTREGTSIYKAGDYIVHNLADGSDSYVIEKTLFEQMYQEVSETGKKF